MTNDYEKWIKRNLHYHKDLAHFYKSHILKGSRVLEVGSGTGYLLNSLEPSYGVGIETSEELYTFSKQKYKQLTFIRADAESYEFNEQFDYIVVSDTLTLVGDVQKLFQNLRNASNKDTRIVINTHNFLWLPLLRLGEKLGLKSHQSKENWLEVSDLQNLLELEDFEIIKTGKRFLFPFNIPFLTPFINTYIAKLPLFNSLCLTHFVIGRYKGALSNNEEIQNKVSVVVPVRNEKGNVENVIKRIPQLGESVEIIFVEGGSTDGTYEEIEKVRDEHKDKDIKLIRQTGKGKCDAVRSGFDNATGDILMILDGDVSVPPEDLTTFYKAIVENKGEFVYGSRLVYPLEKDSMQTLNIYGNLLFSWVFSWLLDTPIKDTLCGTKVISKKNYFKLKSIRSYFGDFDPFGDFELILGAAKLDLKFIEIPIKYKARTYGRTNISRFKNGLQLLKMIFVAANKVKFTHDFP